MVKTGYTHLSNSKIYEVMKSLYLESKDYFKQKESLLKIESDQYIKSVFTNSFLLSERFNEFYKEHEWKLKSHNIDSFIVSELKQIANEAEDL